MSDATTTPRKATFRPYQPRAAIARHATAAALLEQQLASIAGTLVDVAVEVAVNSGLDDGPTAAAAAANGAAGTGRTGSHGLAPAHFDAHGSLPVPAARARAA